MAEEAERRRAEIGERLGRAEVREGELRAELAEVRARAKEAKDSYERLTQHAEEAQVERDLAIRERDLANRGVDPELARQIEVLRAAQAKVRENLEESRRREEEAELQLRASLERLAAVEGEWAALARELEGTRRREDGLLRLLGEAQEQLLLLTADPADELHSDLELGHVGDAPPEIAGGADAEAPPFAAGAPTDPRG